MKVALIDGPNLAYRHYYARLGNPVLDTHGRNVSAVIGVSRALKHLRDEIGPDLWAMAWEMKGPKVRHAMYAGYKQGRDETPSDLLTQLPLVMNMASHEWDLRPCWAKGEEADDVLATLTELCLYAGHQVVIVTADKDMLQLVQRDVTVWAPLSKGEHKLYDVEAVREAWGVPPSMFVDLLALMGDSSDGYPGCHGIGRTTAVKLLSKYGSVEKLYDQLHEVDPRWAEKLRRSQEQVATSKGLAALRRHVSGIDIAMLDDVPRAVADLP